MTAVGYILIGMGVIAFLAGLVMSLVETFKKKDETRITPSGDRETQWQELIAKITELLKEFKGLSIGIQWAILGLACIGVGAYLTQL